MKTSLEKWEALARAGIAVSICCGPRGATPILWTVTALSSEGAEFDDPFAARDFEHAIEIAELECKERGWL